MEPKFDKALLLVSAESSEDLGGIEQMVVLVDSIGVPSKQGHIDQETEPVAVDEEQNSQQRLNGRFRENVVVQSVAEINGIDVVWLELRPR